jgi:hypothetical protein
MRSVLLLWSTWHESSSTREGDTRHGILCATSGEISQTKFRLARGSQCSPALTTRKSWKMPTYFGFRV